MLLSVWAYNDELMLRRILSLSILAASLLFAGLPIMACAHSLPERDCCPSGPSSPCHSDAASAITAIRSTALCCAAGTQAAVVEWSNAPSSKAERHARRTGPAVADSVSAAAAAVPPAPAELPVWLATYSYTPSRSTLYLHTRRLRL
jgi:hypothetical protein